MDATDRKLIEATQAGLPLVREPYRALAQRVGLDEEDIIARLQKLLDSGAIRRIGAIPNHYALGFTANGMSDDVSTTPVSGRGLNPIATLPSSTRRRSPRAE